MEGNVTVFEQQVLKVLNQIAVGIANSQEERALSWPERWGSLVGPILSVGIAVVGWWFIDRSNRRSNRDAFRLQLADAARNRILDSLYDYREFLFDVQSPKRLLLREKSVLKKAYVKMLKQLPSNDDTIGYFEVEQELVGLARFDRRQFDWFGIMQRDGWALGAKAQEQVSCALDELENRHVKIVGSFLSYTEVAKNELRGDLGLGIRFIMQDREEMAVNTINDQILFVNTTIASLQKPLEEFAEHRGAKRLPGG